MSFTHSTSAQALRRVAIFAAVLVMSMANVETMRGAGTSITVYSYGAYFTTSGGWDYASSTMKIAVRLGSGDWLDGDMTPTGTTYLGFPVYSYTFTEKNGGAEIYFKNYVGGERESYHAMDGDWMGTSALNGKMYLGWSAGKHNWVAYSASMYPIYLDLNQFSDGDNNWTTGSAVFDMQVDSETAVGGVWIKDKLYAFSCTKASPSKLKFTRLSSDRSSTWNTASNITYSSSYNTYKITGWNAGECANDNINLVTKTTRVYYDNSSLRIDDNGGSALTYKYLVIGHDNFSAYSKTYDVSATVSNTKLLYYEISSDVWRDATFYGFVGSGSSWGAGSWGSSNLKNASKYTAAYKSQYDLKTGHISLFVPASGSSGAALTATDKGTAASSMNTTQTFNYALSTDNGSTYTTMTSGAVNTPGQLSLASYKFVNGTYNSVSANTAQTLSANATTYTKSLNTVAYTGTTTLTESNTRNGYTFMGWYSGSSQRTNGSTHTYTYYPKADSTLTARYKANQYTVTLNNQGADTGHEGTTSVTMTFETTSNISGYQITLPEKTGYTFNGYYDTEECDGTWIIKDDGYFNWDGTYINSTSGKWQYYTDDVDLYAKWTEDTHTVGVTKNIDAAGTINTTSVSGVGIATSSSTITATPYFGYRFTGWTIPSGVTIASGTSSSTSITINATADSKTITANFAREYAFIEGNFAVQNSSRGSETKTGDSWQDNSTAIQMEYDGTNHRFYLHTYRTPEELAEQVNSADAYFYVKTSTSSSSIENGVKHSAYTSGSSNQDLSACGSSNKKATGTSANNFRITGTEDAYVILYINSTHIWYELECALSYYGNGGTGDAPASRTYYAYGSEQTAATNSYSRTGYTFDEWNTAANGSGTPYDEGDDDVEMNAAEVCLSAQWTENTYNVTAAYGAGGSAATPSSATSMGQVTGGDITATAATGYTFSTWSVTSGSGSFGSATSASTKFYPTAASTVTASFTANVYTVEEHNNGGRIWSDSIENYTYGEGATLPTCVTKWGCDFDGWYDNSGLTGSAVTAIGTSETGNKDYYAKWTSIAQNYLIASHPEFLAAQEGDIIVINITGVHDCAAIYLYDLNSTEITHFDLSATGVHTIQLSAAAAAGIRTYGLQVTGNNFTFSDVDIRYRKTLWTGTLSDNSGWKEVAVDKSIFSGLSGGDFLGLNISAINDGKSWHQYAMRADYDAVLSSMPTETGIGIHKLSAADVVALRDSDRIDITAQYLDISNLYSYTHTRVYTVTLNTNGGTINAGDVTNYTFGTGATLPTNVTRTGYTFAGWYPDEDFEESRVYSISTTDYGDKTYYAKWTANNYTVTLNTNSGTINTGDVTSYTYGVGATLPTDVTKDNYRFDGWYDNEELDGDPVTEIADDATDDKEYWAKWTDIKQEFSKKGSLPIIIVGEGDLVVVEVSAYGESASIVLKDKTGTTFASQSISATGRYAFPLTSAQATALHDSLIVTGTNYTGEVSLLYRKQIWSGTLSDTEGWTASSQIASSLFSDMEEGSFVGIKVSSIKTGGWYQCGLYAGNHQVFVKEVDAAGTYIGVVTAADVDSLQNKYVCLGAQYLVIAKLYTYVSNKYYTISYYEQDGTTPIVGLSPDSYTYGVGATLATPDARTCYTFEGWHKSTISGDKKTKIDNDAYGNYTFVGEWSLDSHTLTWNFNGGSSSDTEGEDYTEAGDVDCGDDLNYPSGSSMSKTGYTFSSWSSDATEMPDEDLTITAQWTANSYTVTLDPDNGNSTTTVSATYDAAMPSKLSDGETDVEAPTFSGYIFGGYYDDHLGAGTQYYDGSAESARTWDKTSTATLYAKWTQTVTLDMRGVVTNLTPTVLYKGTALSGYSASAVFSGLQGYYTAATDGTKVLNADGTFADSDVTDYITDSKWTKTGATTLYAHWTTVSLPTTVNKSNVVAYSSDMTWHGDYDEYFDYGTGDHPNTERWAEWQVNVIPCEYAVTEVFDVPGTGGHQWHLELWNNSGDTVTYTTTKVWVAGGERTEATKWDLRELAAGVYTLRVTNPYEYSQPKLKSITLSSTAYTVTYNANGGTCATESETQSYGCTALTLPTATKDGYVLEGWYDGSTREGGAGDAYTPTSNITLYAKWAAVAPATLDKDNLFTYGGKASIKGDTIVYSSSDATGYAEWKVKVEKCSYTVVIDAFYHWGHQWAVYLYDGATLKSTCSFDSSYDTGSKKETKIWDLSDAIASAGVYTIRVQNLKSGGDPKLLSVTMRLNTITYDANGGTCATESDSQSSCGAALTLPLATRDGYKFAGWYNGSSRIGGAGDDYTPTADITLKAIWAVSAPVTLTKDNLFTYDGRASIKGDTIVYKDSADLAEWKVYLTPCEYTMVVNGFYHWGHQWRLYLTDERDTLSTCILSSTYDDGSYTETKKWDISDAIDEAGIYTVGLMNIKKGGDPKLLSLAMKLRTVFTAATDDKWSKTANWSPSVLPTIEHEVVLEKPATVDVTNAVAKSIVIDQNGSHTGKLTIAANKALVVAGKVQKTTDGETLSATEAADLKIESSSDGNGTLIFTNDGNAATVELYSIGSTLETNWTWQYIGVPFTSVDPQASYYGGYLYKWENNQWNTVHKDDNLTAFTGYSVSYPAANHKYVMDGTLAPTTEQVITVPASSYMVIGNSWTAPIYVKGFTSDDFGSIYTKSVYLFNTGSHTSGAETWAGSGTRYNAGTYVAIPINAAGITGDSLIAPLQGFYVDNTTGSATTFTMNYDNLVRPTGNRNVVAGQMHAPRRAEAEEQPVVLKMWASGTNYDDRLILIEREDFTTDYDAGWDGEKWDAPGKQPMLYTTRPDGTTDAVSALPELDGTIIGFRAGEDNTYTLRFEYAEDNDDLYILDTRTGASTQVLSGNTYTFTADDTEAHARFLLTRNNAPQITTGNANANANAEKATKLILDQKLYIYRNGILYDATGRRVDSFSVGSGFDANANANANAEQEKGGAE